MMVLLAVAQSNRGNTVPADPVKQSSSRIEHAGCAGASLNVHRGTPRGDAHEKLAAKYLAFIQDLHQ